MTLNEVLQFLRENKYILSSKEKGYVLSKTFQQDVKRLMTEGEDKPIIPPVKVEGRAAEYPMVPSECYSPFDITKIDNRIDFLKTINWPDKFIQFINEAKIPARLENNKLEAYAANKYSEDGMKAFRKAIESGIDYGTLVRSTMLYYKSSVRFKKAIGNYMKDGDWRTDYENLKNAAEQGTKELEQHLKTETKDNGYSNYRLG